jgi:hypothetical protein
MCVLCIISHYLYYALHGVFLENELSIYHAATTPLSRCEEAEQPDPQASSQMKRRGLLHRIRH